MQQRRQRPALQHRVPELHAVARDVAERQNRRVPFCVTFETLTLIEIENQKQTNRNWNT